MVIYFISCIFIRDYRYKFRVFNNSSTHNDLWLYIKIVTVLLIYYVISHDTFKFSLNSYTMFLWFCRIINLYDF